MLWIAYIIINVVFVFFLGYTIVNWKYRDTEWVKTRTNIFMIGMVVCLICSIGCTCLLNSFRASEYSIEYQTGVFTIVNDLKYYEDMDAASFSFLTVNENGEPNQLYAGKDNVRITYVEDIQPVAIEYTRFTLNRRDNELWYKICTFGFLDSNDKRYEIYLPIRKSV